jgi:hypothetical protein
MGQELWHRAKEIQYLPEQNLFHSFYFVGPFLSSRGCEEGSGGLALWPRIRGLRDYRIHRQSSHWGKPQQDRGQGTSMLDSRGQLSSPP